MMVVRVFQFEVMSPLATNTVYLYQLLIHIFSELSLSQSATHLTL
jgi:hypothetical protein